MIRFVHLFNYPENVSMEEGEVWYKGEHVPQVKRLPGVRRYRSWKAVYPPFRIVAPDPFERFARLSELWFDSLAAAQQAIASNPALWHPALEGATGFREFEGLFLDEEPQFNLLRDVPAQQYKYITLPMMWPKGIPQIEDKPEDFIINVYMFNYVPEVPLIDAEDWYLGHHNREGKQIPYVVHYKTWKTLRASQEPSLPWNPNRFYRLTELGVTSLEAYRATLDMVYETRVRFTPSPLGRVLGEWRNIFIKPEACEDLLA